MGLSVVAPEYLINFVCSKAKYYFQSEMQMVITNVAIVHHRVLFSSPRIVHNAGDHFILLGITF